MHYPRKEWPGWVARAAVMGALLWAAGIAWAQDAEPPVDPGPAPAPSRVPVIRPKPETPTRVPDAIRVQGAVPTQAAQDAESGEPKHLTQVDTTKNEEGIEINFKETELIEVIKAFAPYIAKNFDVDPTIGKSLVTVINHDKVPEIMAYDVLQAILNARGFTMMDTVEGNLIRVVPINEASDKPDLRFDYEVPPGYDTFSTHIVQVHYADASELAELLRQLGSKYAVVNVYARTNTLIITDTADGIRRMLKVLSEFDIPGFDTVMDIFFLEAARAEVLATQLQDVLLGPEGQAAGAGAGPQRPVPVRPQRPTIPGQDGPLITGQSAQTLRIVSDERLNALVVVASEGIMGEVQRLIERLDVPTPPETNNFHIYELRHADAEEMETVLNTLVGQAPPREGQQGGGPTGEVQPFEKKITISRFDPTNALVIIASPQDYKLLAEKIAQLDVPQRQVHVEAMIIEVVINDTFELAIETTALAEDDLFALNNVVTLANILVQGPLAAVSGGNQSFAGGFIDGTTDIIVPDGAGGLTQQTIPNVPLLLTALNSLTHVDVLSKPSLTTVDNKEASIVVGQEVPFITGSSRSLDQPSVGASVFSRVEREEVGIKMLMTPQISEGDTILMELEVEVSDTVQSNVGADPNIVGPTLQLSKVTNNVVVPDGGVGIIGGLISEGTDRTQRQPPILGDIPVLGNLFKRRTSERSKRNLVVLVSPHIIKERTDFQRVTDYKLDEFSNANVDILFERGFIKKLRTQHDMRKNYRPSESAIGRVRGGQSFSRGDIRR